MQLCSSQIKQHLLCVFVLILSCCTSLGQSKNRSVTEATIQCKWNFAPKSIQAYWLNLDANKDRKNYMENQLKKIGFQSSRVKAITPTSAEYVIEMLEKPCKRNTPKDIAVILSHLKAIHQAIYGVFGNRTSVAVVPSPSNYALIMEDDVRFLYDVDFDALIASAPPDFGILQLVTSNTEAISSLLTQFKSQPFAGSSSSNSSKHWRRTAWNHFTKNGKTSLYWSAQAYIVNKRVVQPFIDDVVSVGSTEDGGRLRFKIVNSFFPHSCTRTKQRPCVLSNCLFADSYIFAGGGPTYVSTIPLFSGARVGLTSTLHQEQVSSHSDAFALIRAVTAELRAANSSGASGSSSNFGISNNAALPSFLHEPPQCSSQQQQQQQHQR